MTEQSKDEESWIHPDSYGAEWDKTWDEIRRSMSESVGRALDKQLQSEQVPHCGDTDEYPIPGRIWEGGTLTAEEIGFWVFIPNHDYDEYALSKEEYALKYPPPPPPTWAGRIRFRWLSLREKLGIKIGSWIAGIDLDPEQYED